jgi:catechol 2,3-dioxygenase-like lactoylglutathione lyase family enzyme
MATVRYMVTDVEASVAFYTRHLGFRVKQQFGPIAILTRDDLILWVPVPMPLRGGPCPMDAGLNPAAGIAS